MATGGSEYGEDRKLLPVSVGCIDHTHCRRVRIVHISDTHLDHNKYLKDIPDGDILIHSGDFAQLRLSQFVLRDSDYRNELEEIDAFFSKLPHKHKLFVAGNHEMNFSQHSVTKTQSLLTNGIYLQDSSVIIEGIKIYGSPWNGLRNESYARGFAVPYENLGEFWSDIPDDTDILITHQPGTKLLDFGRLRKGSKKEYFCDICETQHGSGFFHLGCSDLRKEILERIRPTLHCFGHVHEDHGVLTEDGIVFSNAAMKLQEEPFANVFDYYIDKDVPPETNTTPQNYRLSTHKACVLQ